MVYSSLFYCLAVVTKEITYQHCFSLLAELCVAVIEEIEKTCAFCNVVEALLMFIAVLL